MKDKKISVIIPVYNVEKYLRQCLESVVNQTYRNLEIILIDDGSTDDSGKICDEYAKKDGRIKVIHQKNAGLAGARNSGLMAATGEYIGYIDSDDYIESDMYEKLYILIESTNSDLAVCNLYKGKEDGTWIKNTKFPCRKFINSNNALECFYKSMYVWNKLYRTNFVRGILFVDTVCEDVIYNLTVFKQCKKIVSLNECKYYYRFTPNSILHTKKFKKNRYIFLEEGINKEISYADEQGLLFLKKDLVNDRTGIVLTWLSFLALEKNPDMNDVEYLLKIVKGDFFQFLWSKKRLMLKCFAVSVCISFRLTSYIYQINNKYWGY